MRIKECKLSDRAAVLLGLGLLLAMGLAAVLAESGGFSDWERRYLADAPGTPSLTDWTTDEETESYLADHVPFRQALVAVDSGLQTLTGRRTQLKAWPVANAVLEQPLESDTKTLQKRMEQFDTLANSVGVPWLLLTPPTHGSLLKEQMLPLMHAAYNA